MCTNYSSTRGSFAPTGYVTMPYTLCTGPLLLANSFMQWTRGGVSRQRMEALVKRGVRSGLCAADTPNLTELIEHSDDALFNRVLCNQDHILFPLLPDERYFTYNLRKRNHNRLLTIKQGRLCSCNFVTRMLFKACYQLCNAVLHFVLAIFLLSKCTIVWLLRFVNMY